MLDLPHISDEDMSRALASTRNYAVAVLKKGPAYDPPRTDATIWEHGRRNFALREAGLLSIVCPINDSGPLAGICVFPGDASEALRIIAGDPAVLAGVLLFEIHPTRSFPGDALPPRSNGVRVTSSSSLGALPEISDEFMRQQLGRTTSYTVRILERGPRYHTPQAESIIWEHGRRNMALRAAGLLAVACPIRDDTDVAGVGIFDAPPADVEQIMLGDPAVHARVLTFEVHATRSFAGSALP